MNLSLTYCFIALFTLEILLFGVVIVLLFKVAKSFSAVTVHLTADKQTANHSSKSCEQVVTLKIQALERLLLFVERIQFVVVVKRVFQPDFSLNDFYVAIVQNVQDEFEHNMAQRLYVSENVWRMVVAAKDEIFKKTEDAFFQNNEVSVVKMAELLASIKNDVTDSAVMTIKEEFNKLM